MERFDQSSYTFHMTDGPAARPADTRQESGSSATRTEDDTGVDISVVVPTKNEAAGIRECLESIRAAFDEMGVRGEVIVSDSSSDETPAIAADMGARVVTPDAPGYGYAYQYAFRQAKGDLVVMGDGDTTYDFRELPKLVERHREGADVVLGSRFEGDIRQGAMPGLHRYVGNPLLTAFLNLFYDVGVTDAHSGFRVVSREVIEDLDFRSGGMEFASEMLMQATANGYSVAEVPITYSPRSGEATISSFTDGWRHLRFMLKNAPGELFAVPGVALFVLGLPLMALPLLELRPFGQEFSINSLVAGSLLVLVGWQLVVLAIFSTYAADVIKPHAGPLTDRITATFSLERGLLFGSLILVIGGSVAGYQLLAWLSSGFDVLPNTGLAIVAATTIVLGIQTVFQSFFISILADET